MDKNQFMISCLKDEDFVGVTNALKFGADLSYKNYLVIKLAQYAVDNGHAEFCPILVYLKDLKGD